jgi:hypothetical protein
MAKGLDLRPRLKTERAANAKAKKRKPHKPTPEGKKARKKKAAAKRRKPLPKKRQRRMSSNKKSKSKKYDDCHLEIECSSPTACAKVFALRIFRRQGPLTERTHPSPDKAHDLVGIDPFSRWVPDYYAVRVDLSRSIQEVDPVQDLPRFRMHRFFVYPDHPSFERHKELISLIRRHADVYAVIAGCDARVSDRVELRGREKYVCQRNRRLVFVVFKQRLRPIGKSIERGEFATIDVDVALVDFVPEKMQLGVKLVLFDVDIPRPPPAVGPRR